MSVIIQSELNANGELLRVQTVRLSSVKTFAISASSREQVFNPENWNQCLKRTIESKREYVAIKWKETGETITASVTGFSLPQVLTIQPLPKKEESLKSIQDELKTLENMFGNVLKKK